MILYKLIGCVMLIAATTMCTNALAIRLAKRAQCLRNMASFCNMAGEQIRLFGTPVEKIVKTAAGQYNNLEFLQNYPNAEPSYPFAKTDVQLIKAFVSGLGASDVCGQLKHCEAYFLQFERLAKEVKTESDSKNKLYRVLGLFCGICIAVILI